MAKLVTCPICRKPAAQNDNPYRPFCGQRCKEIDLASWLDGSYRISRPLHDGDIEASVGLQPGSGFGDKKGPEEN